MRKLCLGAGVAIVALIWACAPAAAGCCGGHTATVTEETGPVVGITSYRFEAPTPPRQLYVVNQGPVVSGPALYS